MEEAKTGFKKKGGGAVDQDPIAITNLSHLPGHPPLAD